MRIRECKTTADLDAVEAEWSDYTNNKEFA